MIDLQAIKAVKDLAKVADGEMSVDQWEEKYGDHKDDEKENTWSWD